MAHKYIRENHKKKSEKHKKLQQKRIREWRKEPAIVRIENPMNSPRARTLGWKNKKGNLVVRARIRKGGMRKKRPRSGRKTKNLAVGVTPNLSQQEIAEQRVNKRYPNCTVINSYQVAEDGNYKWFEVLLKTEEK